MKPQLNDENLGEVRKTHDRRIDTMSYVLLDWHSGVDDVDDVG